MNYSPRIYGEKTVAWLYIIFVATSISGDILYWLISKAFAGYAKLFFYPAILIVLIDLIIHHKVKKEVFISLVTTSAAICLVIGLYNNRIEKAFFAHFLPFILPIFAYSYGYRSEFNSGNVSKIIDKYAIKAGYVLTGLVVIYYSLVKQGYIEYFGAGALFAYPIFYAVKEKLYYSASLFYVANLFTGKRSVFLAISVVLLIYIYKKNKYIGKVFTLLTISCLSILAYMAGNMSDGQIFGSQLDRFFIIFQYLSETDDTLRAIDLATSGRLYDALAVIDKLGASIFNWIFGIGFGAVFSIDYSFASETFVTHYSHVTPFAYLLVGGIVLLTIIYWKLLTELKFALSNIDNHLSMMMIYFFIIGFSGAIFFTDVFVWILIGVFAANRVKGKSLSHVKPFVALKA